MLVDRRSLKAIVRRLDAHLKEEVQIIIAGGSAVVVLCPEAEATKDIDVFPTEELDKIVKLAKSASPDHSFDINTAVGSFESYLPDDWESHAVHSTEFSGKHIQVFTPCPEDLAVMKVFRYYTKDAQDIQKLAMLKTFNLNRFKKRFLQMLPVVIGNKRTHAGSFAMIWKKLKPKSSIDTDKVLQLAGVD